MGTAVVTMMMVSWAHKDANRSNCTLETCSLLHFNYTSVNLLKRKKRQLRGPHKPTLKGTVHTPTDQGQHQRCAEWPRCTASDVQTAPVQVWEEDRIKGDPRLTLSDWMVITSKEEHWRAAGLEDECRGMNGNLPNLRSDLGDRASIS